MKEATSETSTSIVVIICVAILIAFFSYMIWPTIKGVFDNDISCSKAKCQSKDDDKDGMVDCTYYSKTQKENISIQCPFKG